MAGELTPIRINQFYGGITTNQRRHYINTLSPKNKSVQMTYDHKSLA